MLCPAWFVAALPFKAQQILHAAGAAYFGAFTAQLGGDLH
jgi:hypothetical protein